MPTDTFYPACDGALRRYTGSETWQQAHDAATGTDVYDTNAVFYPAYSDSTLGLIIRGFYTFDTSALDDSAVVTAVKLRLYGSAAATGSTGSVDVVANTQSSNTSLSAADYNKAGTTSYGSVNLSAWTNGSYNDFTLDSNGIAAVNVSGYTKFATRHSSDRSNSSPGGAFAAQAYSVDQTGTANDPRLEVTYYLPNVTVTSPALAATASLPAPAVSAGSPGTLPTLLDSFTDSDSTVLTSHTPEVGSWSVLYDDAGHLSSLRVKSNRAYAYRSDGFAAVAEYRHSSSFTNGSVSADFTIIGSSGSGYAILALRSSAAYASMNCYRAFLDHGIVNAHLLKLQKVVGGTGTDLGSYDLGSLSGTYNIKLVASGSSVIVYVDGVQRIGVTDSSVSSAGSPSLHIYNATGNSTTTGIHADNLRMDDGSGGVVSPALAASAALPAPTVTVVNPNVTVASPALSVAGHLVAPTVSAADGRFKVTGTKNVRATSGSRLIVDTAGTLGTTSAHKGFPCGTMQANGVVRIMYRRGTQHALTAANPDGVCVTRTSADNFASATVVTTLQAGQADYRSGSLRTLASGRLAHVYFTADPRSPVNNLRSWFSYSDDNGSTWATPVQITSSSFDSNSMVSSDIVELTNGDLQVFAFGRATYAGTTWDLRAIRSTNGGTTWADDGLVAAATTYSANVVEPQAQVLSDGKVMVFFHVETVPQSTYRVVSTSSAATAWGTPVQKKSPASNRQGLLLTPDGDTILTFTPSGTGIELYQSFDDGVNFGSSINPEGSSTSPYIAPIWITPITIAGSGTTPNLAVVWASETAGQDRSSVYYQAMTWTTTYAGPQAGMNLAATVSLPAPGITTSAGSGSATVTAVPLTATASLPAPTVSAGTGASTTGAVLTASVAMPAPVVATTTFTNLIVMSPALRAVAALAPPTSPGGGSEDYRLFFDISSYL